MCCYIIQKQVVVNGNGAAFWYGIVKVMKEKGVIRNSACCSSVVKCGNFVTILATFNSFSERKKICWHFCYFKKLCEGSITDLSCVYTDSFNLSMGFLKGSGEQQAPLTSGLQKRYFLSYFSNEKSEKKLLHLWNKSEG